MLCKPFDPLAKCNDVGQHPRPISLLRVPTNTYRERRRRPGPGPGDRRVRAVPQPRRRLTSHPGCAGYGHDGTFLRTCARTTGSLFNRSVRILFRLSDGPFPSRLRLCLRLLTPLLLTPLLPNRLPRRPPHPRPRRLRRRPRGLLPSPHRPRLSGAVGHGSGSSAPSSPWSWRSAVEASGR